MGRAKRGVIARHIQSGCEIRYDTIVDAAVAHGTSPQTIKARCERGKELRGYEFRFREEREGTLTEQHAKIIMTMADNRLNKRATAKIIGYSDGGVGYQIGQIQSITGKDPCDFWDMIDLVKMAEEILEEAE